MTPNVRHEQKTADSEAAERVNDFAAPDVINLVCRAVVCGDWLSPLLAG